jgi:hypothetical protein
MLLCKRPVDREHLTELTKASLVIISVYKAVL